MKVQVKIVEQFITLEERTISTLLVILLGVVKVLNDLKNGDFS